MAAVAITVIFRASTAVLFIMAGFATISVYLVASGTNAREITGQVRFFQAHGFSGVSTVTGITLDHGVGHF